MPVKTEVEFVCYQEGGFIDLLRALDDLLPQQLVKLPPDDESFGLNESLDLTTPRPFRPTLQSLELHHGREDLLREAERRFSLFQHREEEELEIPREVLFPAPAERVYPFKKPVQFDVPAPDNLPALRDPSRADCGVTNLVERESRNRLPQPVGLTKLTLPSFQSQKSFHDQLMARARMREEERRRAQLANPRYWRNYLLRALPETIIFGAIGTLGSAIIAFNRGIPLKQTLGLVVASGLASVSIVLLIKLPKPGSKSLSNAARV